MRADCSFWCVSGLPLQIHPFLIRFFWVIHRKQSFSLLLANNFIFTPKSYPRVILWLIFSVDNHIFTFKNNGLFFV